MRIPRLPIATVTLAALLPLLPVDAQVIHTVAGGGPADGVVATSASIGPLSPAVDSHGNVYFPSSQAVYKLDPTGHLTRVAGQSVGGVFPLGANGNACPTAVSIGDGGPATSAALNDPMGVAVDAAGNLYIADAFSCRIRVVNMQALSITVQGVTIAAGNIGTVAGSAAFGFNGDSGPATSAQLYQPNGVALDSFGNLYIADSGNSRIRKVDTGGTITTIAGNGTRGCVGDGGPASNAEVNFPVGLAADAAGNIYIADDGGCNIRVVNTQAGTTTVLGVTVASKNIASVAGNGVPGYGGDGGPATSAQINLPHGVALDSFGNLYIADTVNARIREVTTGGTITTFAGNGTPGSSGDGGPATSAEIAAPYGVALNESGDLYIADQSNSTAGSDFRIRVVTHGGTINSVAGNGYAAYSGDGQTATAAEFDTPTSVAANGAGNLFIADSMDNVVRAVNTQSRTITLLGIAIPPGGIATVAGNINLHDCSTTISECFGGDGGPATSAELNFPNGVALDSSGNLYIADSGNFRVRKVDTSGTITTVVGSDLIGDRNGPATGAALNNPLAVTLDWQGNIYVSDNYGNVVRAVNTQSYTISVQGVSIAPGDIATVAGNGTAGYSGDGGTATSAELSSPIGIALDAAGNLYIADSFNSRVRKVDASGNITTVAGNGTAGYSGDSGPATSAELIGPYGVTADASGDLYIADASASIDLGFSALRLVNTQACAIDALGVAISAGNIAPVAGNGTEGFSGDEGLATSAMLDYPTASALDADGNLYIADELNLRIRKVGAPPATGPDFAMSAVNASVQVSQAGNSGTFNITLNSLNGFSGVVGLAVNGNPAMGVQIPASVTLSPGGSQSFNVVVTSAPSQGNGNFFLNVIGTNACGAVHSLKLDLIVGGSTTATPTVTVTPSAAGITSTQALTVMVTVGGTPTPTGSVTLASGAYSSGAVALINGSASINIAAGSLAAGTDTLTATYTPDAASSTIYNSATGSSSVTVTAATVQVTVGTTPAGLSFSVDGASYSSTQSLTWTVGSSHTLATTSPQVLAGAQETLSAWSDGGAISHSVTAPASATAYTATFTATAYQLTTAASPAADGSVSPASGAFYAPGTVVSIMATANAGFSFTNWTGSIASANSASTTVTMNAPESVTANFGTAVAVNPVASLSSVSPLTFTGAAGTTSPAQSATLTNSGNSTLNISGITLTGTGAADFSVSSGINACGTTLAAGANCLIYVTFTPASTGSFSAELSVADNAAGSPQTVNVSGTGTAAPSFTLSSPTAAQTVHPGGATQFTITATAQNGTFSNAVSLSASGLPTGAVATFTPASITPGSSSASSTLSIQTATTATASARSAPAWPLATPALAVIGLCLVPGKRRRRWITMTVLTIASLGAFTALTACGGGFGFTPPSQSYTVTVTGTSGSDVQTTTVQLTEQ